MSREDMIEYIKQMLEDADERALEIILEFVRTLTKK